MVSLLLVSLFVCAQDDAKMNEHYPMKLEGKVINIKKNSDMDV